MANFKQLKKYQRKVNKLIRELNSLLAADPLFNNVHVEFFKREYYYKQEPKTEYFIPKQGVDFFLLYTNDYNNNKWTSNLSFENMTENKLDDALKDLSYYIHEWMPDYLEHTYQSIDEDEWNEKCSNSIIYQYLNEEHN